MKKQNLVIEVKGGLVQAVYSDAAGLSVILVDWDNIKADPGCPGAEKVNYQKLGRMRRETRKLAQAAA